eukprot:991509-Pyramimonas_sp.AAC.1
MEGDDGTQQKAGQTTDEPVTVIIDTSAIALTEDQKAANDAVRAEMTAEIHADEDSGSSILDSILDPPETIITHPDY